MAAIIIQAAPTNPALLTGIFYPRRCPIEPKPTLTSEILIPGLAALITGALLALGVVGYCVLTNQPATAALLVGPLGALLAWLLRAGPQPQAPAEDPKEFDQVITTVHVITQDGHKGDFLRLPVDGPRLEVFAGKIATGAGLTVREWTGQGGLFSGGEFARLRSVLILRGLARWVSARDVRAGVVLTARGKITLAALAPHLTDQAPIIAKSGKA